MHDCDLFDTDLDGDVDGIDFVGFDYFIWYGLWREHSDFLA